MSIFCLEFFLIDHYEDSKGELSKKLNDFEHNIMFVVGYCLYGLSLMGPVHVQANDDAPWHQREEVNYLKPTLHKTNKFSS